MEGDPEGIAWIERKAIKTDNFNPDDTNEFYTHLLVEVVYNASVAHSYWDENTHLPYTLNHRAEEQRWNPTGRDTYVRYKYLSAMYGKEPEKCSRKHRVHGAFDYWMLRDSPMVAYVPLPMPTKDEEFLWLDLTYPIKAIYFPLCAKAHVDYETQCKYVRLNFKARDIKVNYELNSKEKAFKYGPNTTGRKIERAKNDTFSFPRSVERGLDFHPNITLKFDVKSLYYLLCIPREDRGTDSDPYQFVTALHQSSIKVLPQAKETGSNMQPGNIADLRRVLKEMQGVDVEYQANKDKDFLPNLLSGLASVALSLIPYVGPLIACAQQLAYQAMMDPETFKKGDLSTLLPQLLNAIVGSAGGMKAMVNKARVSPQTYPAAKTNGITVPVKKVKPSTELQAIKAHDAKRAKELS